MPKKQIIVILAVLLCFPVFAGAVNIKRDKPGEFASPSGVFDFEFDPSANESFSSQGILSKDPIFQDKSSADFSSSGNLFTQGSTEFMSADSTFNTDQSEFRSSGIISNIEELRAADEDFSSPEEGDFKFSLSPKKKKRPADP